MRSRLSAIVGIATLSGSLAAANSQGPPDTGSQAQARFRTTAEYVQVDAVVTDRNGRVQRGLRKEDF
jgi:hypothetical protein